MCAHVFALIALIGNARLIAPVLVRFWIISSESALPFVDSTSIFSESALPFVDSTSIFSESALHCVDSSTIYTV